MVVTCFGSVVRVSDGKVLAHKLGKLEYASPLICDDVAYFIQNGGKAVRLSAGAEETVQAEPLWTTAPPKDRYYASPVIHDGLIYGITQKSVLSIIDATTGAVLSSEKLDLGGTVFPSLALAGGMLFVSSDNGKTLVLKPGRTVEQVAVNALERFRASPVFDGKRLYIRGLKTLYCIGQR